MERRYLAHIREDGTRQTVEAHCRNTAAYAKECLKKTGMEDAAYLSGLLHDMGKCQVEFQDYLFAAEKTRGSVIHTFQGCRYILEHFHVDGAQRYEDITSELAAYAIGAHHGLFDCVDDMRNSGFEHRMTSGKDNYDEAKNNFLKECADAKEIEKLFEKANDGLLAVYGKAGSLAAKDGGGSPGINLHFYIGMLARMLASAVIEGDRRDTAEFMSGTLGLQGKSNIEADDDADRKETWNNCLSYLENKLEEFGTDTAVKKARMSISEQCKNFADCSCGVYRLNVPTGSGKTLAALRFALAHAAIHDKQRIIYTAPLLTILDQNSEEIRSFIGNDRIVLEHYSNIINCEDGEDLDARELLLENWKAPVIITSMVQLLNTMFKDKTSSIRRFNALCNSVVIIDEVQTIPSKMLSMFNMAVNFLTSICGTTFVLCSATQPAFKRADYPISSNLDSIVPYDKKIWMTFHRTDIIDAGNMVLPDIAAFAMEKLNISNNILVICNKKAEAEYIYKVISDSGIYCLHLSAAMCQAHRRDVLKKVEEALIESKKSLRKFILVATQVVEAGVDISFECVIRLSAGMDSVVQSAGRCNRHGEMGTAAPVYLINCLDEDLSLLSEIRDGKTATGELLEKYVRNPIRFENSLSSDISIDSYYERLYSNMALHAQDYALENGATLFDLLSANTKYADKDFKYAGKYFMRQAFKTAGMSFQVFDDDSEDVIVPYGAGRLLIDELYSMQTGAYAFPPNGWLEKVKPYTVSVYNWQKEKIGNGIETVEGVFVLQENYYNAVTGLMTEGGMSEFLEV